MTRDGGTERGADGLREVLDDFARLELTVVDELVVVRTTSSGAVTRDLRVEVRGPSGGLHGVRLARRSPTAFSADPVAVSWSSLSSTPRVRSLGLDLLAADEALPPGSPGTLRVSNASLRRLTEVSTALAIGDARFGRSGRIVLPSALAAAPEVGEAVEELLLGRELSSSDVALLTDLLDDLAAGVPLEWALRHRATAATP